MGLLGSYAGRLRLHALRKKSVLLLLLIASALVVLCLQYNTKVRSDAAAITKSNLREFDDERKYNDIIGIGDLFQKNRGKSVQFLMVSIRPENDRPSTPPPEAIGPKSRLKQSLGERCEVDCGGRARHVRNRRRRLNAVGLRKPFRDFHVRSIGERTLHNGSNREARVSSTAILN